VDIEQIAAAAAVVDGADPLDEATRLALRHHPGRVWSLVRDDGFALVVDADLSLVVHPDARGRGVGGALLADTLRDAPRPPMSAWSHGDHPAAARLATAYGFRRARELWVMRRAMAQPLPEPVRREGVTVRGYTAADADELLRVNAAAFAAHPEQGGMDAANLAERMAEPWFDPAGLLLAVDGADRAGDGEGDGDRLLGFHWTKQHSPALGEVYVVGIDPAAQGRGLGKLLTLAGLRHLAGLGVDEVLLYVESDNAAAIAVYAGLGFAHAPADTHVRYQR
jgi:mycothiol synthase